jgi:hypothetical protein
MNKKLGLIVYLLSFLIIIPVLFYLIHTSISLYSEAKTVTLSDRKVIYDLPYPGILPDHPLYVVKAVRDRILDWLTRDNIKKAELYLLYSDKRLAMTVELENKGKISLAISTLTKSEKYFAKIPDLVAAAKKQGGGPTEGLIHQLKLSNDKHREVIEQTLKQSPQGEEASLNWILDLNSKIKKQLESI